MQDNKSKPFCIAPWVSIQYGAMLLGGGVSPCCEWQGEAFKGSLESYFNSFMLRKIKTAMINHDYSVINETCEGCLFTESLNLKSARQLLHERNLNIDDGLQIIDYRPSNLCNLKCRMCFSENSSLIAKEENKEIIHYDTRDIFKIDFGNSKFQLKIVGGEPTISDEVHNFLASLVSRDYSKNIDLIFTTNATNANAKWMNLITKFKSCYAIISLDGTGAVYEYIRTNANWDSVLKTVNVYETNNIDINFQITASMYNMPVVENWIEWFFTKDNVNIFPVEGRRELTLAALPDDIRQEKIKYLTQFDNSLANDAIKILSADIFDPTINSDFKKYTYAKDKIRNTNILDVSTVFQKIIGV